MTREIKFRVWDRNEYCNSEPRMVYSEYHLFPAFVIDYWEAGPVMQFTGAKDKKGKDIYEGDILGYSDKRKSRRHNYVVKWQEGYCEEYGDWSGFFVPNAENLEILGNIYENPELIPK